MKIYSSLFFVFFLLFANWCNGQSNKNYIIEKKFLTIGSGVSAQDVYCVNQDKNGFLWFGTKGGLNRFDGNNFRLFSKSNGLSSNLVSNIVIDSKNRIFIEHGNQWQPFDIDRKIDVLDANQLTIVSNQFVLKDYPGEIKSDLVQGRNWRIKYLPIDSCWDKELTKEREALLYITQRGSGQLLITKENGAYYIERDIRVKIFEGHEFYDNGNTEVNHFYKDDNGNLWICVKKGIYQVKISPNRFQKYFTIKDVNSHVIPQSRGIWVEHSGKDTPGVVHAVVMNGVVSNKGSGTFSRRMGLGWALLGIGDSLLYAVENRVFFATNDNTQSHLIGQLQNSPKDLINCIYPLNDSLILIGGSSNVFIMNRLTGQSEVIHIDMNRFPPIYAVYRIFSSSKGVLAVAENGLFLIQNDQVVDYFGASSKKADHQIHIQSILDAHEDQRGVLWIASNGAGLFQWEWKSGKKPKVYNRSDGLPSDIIYRIEEDDNGNIWVSTDDGLCRYAFEKKVFKVFTVADGLPSQEFNRTSSFKDSNGTLYFGGVNGVVSFNPEDFEIEQQSNRLMITAFARFTTKDVGFKDETVDFYYHPAIIIHPNDYMVKLEFALLDYGISKPLYWYRIKGVVDEWYLLESNTLVLGSLSYGNYILEIKALSQSGFGVPQVMEIPIEVAIPFYWNFWFLFGLGFLVLFLVIFAVRWRGKILKRRNVFLEGAILERTSDLKSALLEKENLLKELHHRVKNNLQLVIGLLDLQKEEVEDEKSKALLINSQMRLMSISLIHQHFYKSADLAFINFDFFLKDLLREMKSNFGQHDDDISFEFLSKEKELDIDIAIPLGMIINELVTNSFKHIPSSFSPIQIEITIRDANELGMLELIYTDNGPGITDKEIFENPQTLGLKLVRGLTAQIRGKVEYEHLPASRYKIRFKRALNKKKWDA